MRTGNPRTLSVMAVALTLSLAVVEAQEPAPPQPAAARTFSIGQPRRKQPYVVAGAAWDRAANDAGANLLFGVHRSFFSPVSGAIGAAAEAYGAFGGASKGGGGRLILRSPFFGVGAGADANVGAGRAPRADILLTYQSAIRRGGLFGHGTMLRLDWIPGRHTLGAGIHVPLLQPLAGRTRPRNAGVRLPDDRVEGGWPSGSLSAAADTALAAVTEAAMLLRSYATLYEETSVPAVDEGMTGRRATRRATYVVAVTAYQRGLARLFGEAAGDSSSGVRLEGRARAGLLEAVLIPYDSLFGRVKEGPSGIRGLTSGAHSRFARWVRDSSGVAGARQASLLLAHARWLAVIEDVHRTLVAQVKDTRFIWMPLQLALIPEQYDEQAEVDALIARMIGRPFTDENALSYLRSRDLPLEVARTVYAARVYHVLWVHDVTGVREGGTVDNIGYEMVADAYFAALTAAVKRYDSTGTLPVYTIVLDQYWYEPRQGRLWLTMLENPLYAKVSIPDSTADRTSHLQKRQAELRAAVAASPRLQRDAARLGDSWLRNVVKVHVNVTQPSDFSFRSHHIIPPLPFVGDNIMRDHRKIVFYDLNEAEPYRGAMILMGIGIGENYASATWEDRGYRLRGPATLEVRAALRRQLIRNGFREADIPGPLRAVDDAKVVERRTNRGDYVGRALQVHNEVGFGRKESSVVRAMLYELAQPGSVVIVPDPQWLSVEWAALLAGAAARGAKVHIIQPSLENVPMNSAPVIALAREVMLRMLRLRAQLADQLRESGGELRIGLFTGRAPANDIALRRQEIRAGLQRAPWIKELIPFEPATLAVLDRAEAVTASDSKDATDRASDEKPRPPQLHQKTQLIARPGAIAVLVRQPGWDAALARSMEMQSRQTARFADQLEYEDPEIEIDATRKSDAMLLAFEEAMPAAERKRVNFYFLVGTQNHDPRGLASDGEATLVTSGFQGATGLVDLYYMMARSEWITTPAELDKHLPPTSRFMRLISRVIRAAL